MSSKENNKITFNLRHGNINFHYQNVGNNTRSNRYAQQKIKLENKSCALSLKKKFPKKQPQLNSHLRQQPTKSEYYLRAKKIIWNIPNRDMNTKISIQEREGKLSYGGGCKANE